MQADIENSLTVLRNGGTLLYPTDTIWGLGCDATDERAVEKIISIKNRPAHKSFVLLATEKMLLEYVATLDLAIFEYLANTTKPTTVIYRHAVGIAENAVAEDGSIAIRICKEAFCETLLHRFKKPILSTSANFSGEATPAIFKDIDDSIKNSVDYVVKYRQQDAATTQPSAIVQWENGDVTIIRP